MDKDDLPSDSDESDVDYAPDNDSNPPSEVESDGDAEEDPAVSGDEGEVKGVKRKRKQNGGKKKAKRTLKAAVEDEAENGEVESEEQKTLTEEEEKKKTDSLWSDFMSSTPSAKPKPTATVTTTSLKKEEVVTKEEPPKKVEKDKKVTITKIFEFAGEEVRVTKEVSVDSAEARLNVDKAVAPEPTASRARAPGGLKGLSAVLGQLGKKEKIGTLEKSKLDWDRFKKTEGIEDEVQTFNRGKDGYLEKQDFLQRADLRQFEIEKDMRTTRRSNR